MGSPCLSQRCLQSGTDTKTMELIWSQPLSQWTVANINKTLKPRLCATLAEARAVLQKCGATGSAEPGRRWMPVHGCTLMQTR